ncbi:hypothetical protein [Asanoa sp. NPDC050611]|uniref:hypothetical protein n=1 Tax=Asanoa sp. NPDC050611 TaxID=3157098 RepID=UPI0033CC44A0
MSRKRRRSGKDPEIAAAEIGARATILAASIGAVATRDAARRNWNAVVLGALIAGFCALGVAGVAALPGLLPSSAAGPVDPAIAAGPSPSDRSADYVRDAEVQRRLAQASDLAGYALSINCDGIPKATARAKCQRMKAAKLVDAEELRKSVLVAASRGSSKIEITG